MKTLIATFSAEPLQFLIYTAVAFAVTAGTAVLYAQNRDIYREFLGQLNPVLVMALVSLLGLLLLGLLVARGWFYVMRPHPWRGLLVAGGFALLFAVVIIAADFFIRYPPDINRPYPQSLLFYPTIGFLVDIVFHVLPLTMILLVVSTLFPNQPFETIVWPVIIIVALLEPVFQAALPSNQNVALWARVFVFLHIFLINLCQLFLFRRYDFISMYGFRIVYYLLWHVLWGVLRLQVLFA